MEGMEYRNGIQGTEYGIIVNHRFMVAKGRRFGCFTGNRKVRVTIRMFHGFYGFYIMCRH
jgi:hypothetical protein